jgi:proteasome lid subunit RPN8/RPN11
VSLKLGAGVREAIARAAEEGYPHEVCGLLVGRPGLGAEEAWPCPNSNTERASDRYQLEPQAQLRLEKRARQLGLDVVGYYHSHPDHPAAASETDNGLSWEDTTYLIQSVLQGRAEDLRGWRRAKGEAVLKEIPLD